MHPQFNQILTAILGLLAGGIIGLFFGIIQNKALHRNQKLQESGKLNSGWAVMPGSGKRVAYLLVTLALIQYVCPLLFANGSQWWVSGGVTGGYGWMLFRQLQQRLARNR